MLELNRRLRIFLSFCTLRPEMGAEEHAAAASSQIRWGLRIEGRLLDEEVSGSAASQLLLPKLILADLFHAVFVTGHPACAL